MSRSRNTDWKWYAGPTEEPEIYDLGPYATRAEALAEGLAHYGSNFSIIEATKEPLPQLNARPILDRYEEDCADEGVWGEDGDGYAVGKARRDVAVAALQAVLDAWWAEHRCIFREPWLFGRTRHEEFIPPPPTDDEGGDA